LFFILSQYIIMNLSNFSPSDTELKLPRKTKKKGLTIKTSPSPPRSGLTIQTSPERFMPSKSGLDIETNALSSPRFAPLTSGLAIDISPPRFAIPMGTSPPISSLMTLGNLSPEHEIIMTPAKKSIEIKKYTKIFKEMAKNDNKPIMVTNPKNHTEKIELYKLFKAISKSLLSGGEYIFKEGYDKTVPILGSTRRTRKYDGVYAKGKGKGKTYSITANAYNNGPTEFTKQTCLSMSNSDYVKGFVSILHEICLMYYASELNKHRHLFQEEKDAGEQKLVVIPELYKIEILRDDGMECINIHMEKLEVKQKATTRLEPTFNKWNGITTQIFQYFRHHNLAHLDTNPNNVFLTTNGKLAIIDFGESILPDTEVNLRQAKPTGYLKTGNTMAGYNEWLRGRKTGFDGMEGFHDPDDYWGGGSQQGSNERSGGSQQRDPRGGSMSAWSNERSGGGERSKTKTQKQRIKILRKTVSKRK
jgi:hypothetical protein